jgi:hypothetical protein
MFNLLFSKQMNYFAKSTVWGAVTTGRLILLFFPENITLDIEKKEVSIDSGEASVVNLSDLIDAELVHHRYCVDILLESKTRRYTVRGLDMKKAGRIKNFIRNYIWEQIVKN